MTGCKKSEDKLLDPEKPITVTVWHYYNGNVKDKFDALVTSTSSATGGIPAEIAARRKQYEYYREKLLTFEPLAN